MRISLLIFSSVFCIYGVQAQIKTIDNLTIEVLDSRVSSSSVYGSSYSKQMDLVKVMVRTKLKSKEKIDVNEFSLVNDSQKIRLRASDVSRGDYPIVYDVARGKKDQMKVKDRYYDYSIEGYQDIIIPMNFGTKRNPEVSEHNFYQSGKKKMSARFFFYIPQSLAKDTFHFYYRDKNVKKVKFVAK